VTTAAFSASIHQFGSQCCLDSAASLDLPNPTPKVVEAVPRKMLIARPVEAVNLHDLSTEAVEAELVRRRSSAWAKERQSVIDTCLEMNTTGINQGTSGNVSMRVEGGFLITPSGVAYTTMRPEQVVFMDNEGGYYGDFLPSSEWRMHYDIYKAIPNAKAVVHAHPTFCTALAAQRRNIPSFHYMVGIAGGKEVRCAEYATFGSQDLSNSVIRAMGDDTKACLMANHGMICYEKNLASALKLAVEVECLSKQYIEASSMGPPTLLSDDEMDIILAKFKTYGKQSWEISQMSTFQQTHAVEPPERRDKPQRRTLPAARAALAPPPAQPQVAAALEPNVGSLTRRDVPGPSKPSILELTEKQPDPEVLGSSVGSSAVLSFGAGAALLLVVAAAGRYTAGRRAATNVASKTAPYVYAGKGRWQHT